MIDFVNALVYTIIAVPACFMAAICASRVTRPWSRQAEDGMPKAIEVATELRRVADALAAQPETLVHKPWLCFYCDTKQPFLNTFSLLPKPLKKRYDNQGNSYDRVHLEYQAPGIDLDCSVYRSQVCTLVAPATPAEYRCEPLLSEEEEATFTPQQ